MRVLTATVAVCAAAVFAGCGHAGGSAPSSTQLLVSQDFGDQPIIQTDRPKVSGAQTVMRLLQRNATVTTRHGGGVQSIGTVGAGRQGVRATGWFFYVNGLQADKSAATVKLHDGDRVWWDYHDSAATSDTTAVVGQFPEPFVHGIDGRRLPTRVECAPGSDVWCSSVQDKLVALGLPAAKGGVGSSFVKDTLRILVGPWRALREDRTAAQLERGPAISGVYARPASDGRSITLLDATGRPTRTLGPGTGLIAATATNDEDDPDPVWLVTGTDARGVQAAAQALDEGALSGRFAIAVSSEQPIALPDRR